MHVPKDSMDQKLAALSQPVADLGEVDGVIVTSARELVRVLVVLGLRERDAQWVVMALANVR